MAQINLNIIQIVRMPHYEKLLIQIVNMAHICENDMIQIRHVPNSSHVASIQHGRVCGFLSTDTRSTCHLIWAWSWNMWVKTSYNDVKKSLPLRSLCREGDMRARGREPIKPPSKACWKQIMKMYLRISWKGMGDNQNKYRRLDCVTATIL